jgi:glycine/D-amino acid oxidase-like deaminating enzyme
VRFPAPPDRDRRRGVGGTSIAYHLARLGWGDVVLADRAQLTSGSTFHSAGLVGQLRGSVSLTRMMMHSVELYRELDTGWVECGGIRLASSEERMEELRRQAGWAKTFGLPLELISAEEARELFPLMSTDVEVGWDVVEAQFAARQEGRRRAPLIAAHQQPAALLAEVDQ